MKPIENPAYASWSPTQEKAPSTPSSTNTGTNQGLPGSMGFTGNFQPITTGQPATGTGQYAYYPYQYMMAAGNQQPGYMGTYGTTSMPGYMGSFGTGQMPAYLSNTNWSSTGTLPTQPKEQKSGDAGNTRNLASTYSETSQKTNTLTKGNRPGKKGSSRKARPSSQRPPKDEAPTIPTEPEPEPEPVPAPSKKVREPPKNLEHYVSILIKYINYIFY